MATDIGIYANFLRPPKSVQEYQAEADAQQANQLALQLSQQQIAKGRAQADEYQRGLREDQQLRNVLLALSPGAPMSARVAALQGTGLPKGYAQADALQKAALDQAKLQAEISDKGADTAKKQSDVVDATLQRFRGALDYIDTTSGLARWFQAQYADPIVGPHVQKLAPLESVLARLQQVSANPEDFANFRAQVGMGMDKYTKHRNDQAVAQETKRAHLETEGRENANSVMTKQPNGTYAPNAEFIAAKARIAKSGASSTQVSVNTEKTYAGHVAEGLAKADVAALDAAAAAPERVRSAREVLRILTTEKPITGTGAEARLALTKALSTAGLIDGSTVKSTEDLANLLANQTLDAISTSKLGTGQGFTDKDLRFLELAKSGRIEVNDGTLRRIAGLNERAALASIERGNKVAKRLKANPTFGSVGQDLETPVPESPPTGFRMPTADDIAKETARRRAQPGGR